MRSIRSPSSSELYEDSGSWRKGGDGGDGGDNGGGDGCGSDGCEAGTSLAIGGALAGGENGASLGGGCGSTELA